MCYKGAPATVIAPTAERPLLVHHVARRLELSPRMVRHLAAQRELKGFKQPDTPKIWRFSRKDVEIFLAKRTQP